MNKLLTFKERCVLIVVLAISCVIYLNAPDKALIVSGLMVNFAIGFATFYSAKATADSAKSAQISADVASAAQRPRFAVSPRSNAVVRKLPNTDCEVTVRFQLMNYGATAAEMVDVRLGYCVSEVLPDVPSYDYGGVSSIGTVIQAKELHHINTIMHLDAATFEDLQSRRKQLWIYGYMEYKDYLDELWVKGYAAMLSYSNLRRIGSSFFDQAGTERVSLERCPTGKRTQRYEYTRRRAVDRDNVSPAL
ncbi:hypothetical protein NOV72_06101 [Caballeronia novacaledonica]|uniref:Lipoprotein n=1 Tax=Caballeronia novacaledonica TaxID=1544861 RepID=A0A2U3IFB1_9BURK|nr:hypothetical protein [Caballeronia novacaledonica]SPB18896.1 hypothetical protein NOV72_06101 [Caballeronia novacaledonica]